MRAATRAVSLAAWAALGVACTPASTPEPGAPVLLGPAGGTAYGRGGASVTLPPGAAQGPVTLQVAEGAPSAPPLPEGVAALGSPYTVTPHGTTFGAPVEVALPLADGAVPSGGQLVVLKAEPDGGWEPLRSYARLPGQVVVAVQGFSSFTLGVRPFLPPPIAQAPPTLTLAPAGGGEPFPLRRTGRPHLVRVLATASEPVSCAAAATPWLWVKARARFADLELVEDEAVPWPAGLAGPVAFNWVTSTPARWTDPGWYPGYLPGGLSYSVSATLVCSGTAGSSTTVAEAAPLGTDISVPAFTTLGTGWLADVTVAEGARPTWVVAVVGGPVSFLEGPHDQYQLTWERSDDSGRAWTPVGLGYQGDAFQVDGLTVPWEQAAWNTFLGPPATAADDGALFRAVACYTPPLAAEDCAVSRAARLAVTAGVAAPLFSTQPADAVVVAGTRATFTAAASGAPAYQWQRQAPGGAAWVDLPGERSASYTTPPVGVGDTGTRFRVQAVSGGGTATSAAALLAVMAVPEAPVILVQPLGLQAVPGDTVHLLVVARGTDPLWYQWRRGGVPVPGATSATLDLVGVTAGDSGARFDVVVMNGAGYVVSTAAVLTVVPLPGAPPAITAPLLPLTVAEGAQASFTVGVNSAAAPSFAWTLGGAALPCSSATCAFTPAWTDSGKAVAVTVSNGTAPDATSSAQVTVTVPDLAAAITTQPASQQVVEPAPATFTVTASGTPALTYQWQQAAADGGWADLPGATAAAYTTPATSAAASGARLRVVVRNTTRTPPATTTPQAVTSAEATLQVAPPASALLATSIAAGYGNSLVVDPAGAVWAWGRSVDLGTGGYEASGSQLLFANRPVRVAGLAGVSAVATSGKQYRPSFYALHRDGTVSAWGSNDVGQLGDGTLADQVLPVKVMSGGAPVDKVCAIAAAPGLLFLVRSEEPDGACGPGTVRRAWVAGFFTGSAGAGGLPLPGTSGNGAVLQYVPLLPVPAAGATGASVKAVWASHDSTFNAQVLFSLEGGGTFAWGSSYDNCLGAGATTIVGLGGTVGAVDVSGFWAGVQQVEGGFGLSLARLLDGTVAGVGRNAEGELGVGTLTNGAVTPASRVTLAAVPGLAGVSTLSAGYTTAMAIAGGQLWVWGYGYDFVAGLASPFIQLAPVQLAGSGFTAVAVGDSHALVLGAGGAVYALGSPASGALGNGAFSGPSATSPLLVTRP